MGDTPTGDVPVEGVSMEDVPTGDTFVSLCLCGVIAFRASRSPGIVDGWNDVSPRNRSGTAWDA